MYFVCVGPNSMDSNPKYATSRWDSLEKTYKIVINHIFMMKNMSDIKKKQKPPYFHAPTTGGSEYRK